MRCAQEGEKHGNEKLEVLIPYLLEYSPFYRDKCARAKLTARDIRSVDDLVKLPPTTKDEMVADVTAHPPWGTYLAIEEVVRSLDTLGDEFAVILTNDTGPDELTVQVETRGALAAREREALEDELGRRLRAVIEGGPRVEIVSPNTIPRPEFKASCVRNQRRELCGNTALPRGREVSDGAV